jgi:hypothetical protein
VIDGVIDCIFFDLIEDSFPKLNNAVDISINVERGVGFEKENACSGISDTVNVKHFNIRV